MKTNIEKRIPSDPTPNHSPDVGGILIFSDPIAHLFTREEGEGG